MAKILSKLLAAGGVVVVVAGCGSVPVYDQPVTQQIYEENQSENKQVDSRKVNESGKTNNSQSNVSCPNCKVPAPVYYAITRPMICNDYPVTHRLSFPGQSGKVNLISSVEVNLGNSNFQVIPVAEPNCCR